MPLSMVSTGQTVIIKDIRGGLRIRRRLLDLGLNHGARVRVVKNQMTGPMIVAVKDDGRLAVGRGMSHHIMVAEA